MVATLRLPFRITIPYLVLLLITIVFLEKTPINLGWLLLRSKEELLVNIISIEEHRQV
jgi:hypothetical protein